MSGAREPEDTRTWLEVREQLYAMIGERHFASWFESTAGRIETTENGVPVLRLIMPSRFHHNWVSEHYSDTIGAVWQRFAPGGQVVLTIQEKPKPEPEKAALVTVKQLDFWDDGKRAAPNAVFRSALFPALSHQTRKFIKEKTLCSVQGIKVIFTGEQFDQSDLDVYLELLNLARPLPLGTPVRFSAYSLLKALGRQTGNRDHQWLHSVLIRLRGGTVDITDHKKRYFGGLIEGGFKDELTKHYEIIINPGFAEMFGYGMWATIDRAQRYALGRNGTAKALHAYYSTHADPDAHKFDTLAGIAGLTDRRERQRRERIIKAHDLLQSQEVGFLSGYEVKDDTIKADVQHTPGQLRHIAKRVLKKAQRPCQK